MAEAKYINEVGLFDELKLALSRTTSDDLKSWSKEAVCRVPAIANRRVKNFSALVSGIGKALGKEVGSGVDAWKNGNSSSHLGQRTAAGIDITLDFGKRTWRTVELVSKSVLEDPKKNAPGVLALALGFIAGSGGVAGNGGIPDTDIAMWGLVTTARCLRIRSLRASS